jgi:hypothetical protein
MPMTPEELAGARKDEAMRVERAEVLRTWARYENGRPVVCQPGRKELRGTAPLKTHAGTLGKIIYDDQYKAELAAKDLEGVTGNKFAAYPCTRSKHWHLTTVQEKSEPAKRKFRRR